MKKPKIISVLLFLALGVPGILLAQAPNTGPSVLPEVKTYDELRQAISKARAESRVRVEKAVEQERVREAWEIGRLIDAHVLQRKERADYGAKVLNRLATDLGMSRTELSYMLQFARAYPIFRMFEELTWSHYESLLALNDPREREEVAVLASKEKWPVKKLREEVKKRKAAKKTGSPAESGVPVPLNSAPGKPGTYRVIQAFAGPYKGQLALDLGFSNYYRPPGKFPFKDRQIVESAKGKLKRSHRTEADLFTYEADIYRALDGDTLMAVVDLGFGITTTQTLRLRGIDCPEIATRDGMEAKEFVENALQTPGNGERGTQAKASDPVIARSPAGATRQSQAILIKTVKSDKYDRYLADVFLIDAKGQEVYLNNLLLEQGHAVRVSE